MRFEEACGGWQSRRLTQEEAARLHAAHGISDSLCSSKNSRSASENFPGAAIGS